MRRQRGPRDDPSRPWLAFGVGPPQPARCEDCGAANASFGIGPPLRAKLYHYCGTCNERQPETQAALAQRAREAIMEGELLDD
jgi:hypothetical protein